MSVHVIFLQRGAKFMRPICTREEYMALRDSDFNRRAQKRDMVQMNYSCLPNDDGSLRGSTRMSTTVGMDVDIPQLPGEEESTYRDRLAAIPQTVMQKKDELGLLMLEESASKGYHLVFRRREGLTQEENLKWASELLQVAYDPGAKDITRVFYTPAQKLLFLDDAIFEIDNSLGKPSTVSALVGETSVGEISTGSASPEPSSPEEQPLPVSLHAFDLCVKEAGLDPQELDVYGQHNWHTNLMAVLSVGLPKLMTREQLLAVVRVKLPNYSQTEDCRQVIAYFYEKYDADRGFMGVTLRGIHAKAIELAKAEQEPTPAERMEQDEKDMNALADGWTPPELPKRIPRILDLLTANFDPRFREMLLLSALPVLAAHASHFRATYLSGRVTPPQQFVAIIGNSGSGKNNATELFKQMIQNTLQAHDDHEWVKVYENAELRDKKANAKDRPAKYQPKLRIFETTSKSSILALQSNLGKNGMLLGQFSEVDGLASSSGVAYSNISVLLRKGWDGDMHRQYYMSESTCNAYAQMSISLLMEGTVKAMLQRMFNDSNCEGGFMQRCIPVIMPKKKRTFRPPCQNYLSDDEKVERDALLMDLYQKDLALGDEVRVLELPLMNKAIGQWFDSLEERYNDGLLTEAEADLSHRCGEFMLRAAIPLVALYGKETREIVDFCRWVGEIAHYNLCHIFGQRVQRDLMAADKLLEDTTDARKTAEPLLSKMALVFTLKEFQDMREKQGQSTDVKMLLSRYCKNGKLERVGRGVYRQTKGNMVTVTKMSDQPSTEES